MFDSTIRRSVATLGVVAVVVLIGANDYGFTEGNGQPTRDGDGQDTQASLGREGSIECLVRAEASDERPAQARKPAPLGITLCHEGFEIK